MKIGVVVGLIVAIAVAALIANSTFRPKRYRAQVCVFYNNRYNCKTVAARSRQAAIRSGIENACADITAGMDEVMGCQSAEPKSVKWLQ